MATRTIMPHGSETAPTALRMGRLVPLPALHAAPPKALPIPIRHGGRNASTAVLPQCSGHALDGRCSCYLCSGRRSVACRYTSVPGRMGTGPGEGGEGEPLSDIRAQAEEREAAEDREAAEERQAAERAHQEAKRTDASGTGEGDVIAGAGWVARPPTGGGTSSTEPKAEEARREAAGGQAAAAEDDEASRPSFHHESREELKRRGAVVEEIIRPPHGGAADPAAAGHTSHGGHGQGHEASWGSGGGGVADEGGDRHHGRHRPLHDDSE